MISLTDGRKKLYQWDTGRTVTVNAECSQVHFQNDVTKRSLDVVVENGIAKIPDILLQSDKDLFVWVFVGTSANGYTKISETFKVTRRSKPADYVFTPEEQITLAELTKRIEDLENSTNQGQKPQLYAPTISITNTILKITDNSKNSFLTTGYNLYVNGVYKIYITSNKFDLNSLALECDTYSINVTSVGGGFGIEFKESNLSETLLYKQKSSTHSIYVCLESSKKSKTINIEGDYDFLTINGIDGLTYAINDIIYNDDGTITINYNTNVDIDIVIYYTKNIY